jgi:hypothetical protein
LRIPSPPVPPFRPRARKHSDTDGETGMGKASAHPPQDALAAARARLFSAALGAQARDALTPEQIVRVRRALKAGRSKRCSKAGMDYAAQRCILLAREIEHGLTRDDLPQNSWRPKIAASQGER